MGWTRDLLHETTSKSHMHDTTMPTPTDSIPSRTEKSPRPLPMRRFPQRRTSKSRPMTAPANPEACPSSMP